MVSLSLYFTTNYKCRQWSTSSLHVHDVIGCSYSPQLCCIGCQCREVGWGFFHFTEGCGIWMFLKAKGSLGGEVYSGFWNFLLSFLCFSGKICLTPEPTQTNTCARRCSGFGRNGSLNLLCNRAVCVAFSQTSRQVTDKILSSSTW